MSWVTPSGYSFSSKAGQLAERRAQQLLLFDRLREMEQDLVQAKFEPAQPEAERVIDARRRLREQLERFVGLEFAPGAEQFEQRKTVRPFEHEEAAAIDRFEIEDAEQIRVLAPARASPPRARAR